MKHLEAVNFAILRTQIVCKDSYMCWTIDAKDPTVPTVGIQTGSTVGIVGALLRSMGLGQSLTGLVVTIL